MACYVTDPNGYMFERVVSWWLHFAPPFLSTRTNKTLSLLRSPFFIYLFFLGGGFQFAWCCTHNPALFTIINKIWANFWPICLRKVQLLSDLFLGFGKSPSRTKRHQTGTKNREHPPPQKKTKKQKKQQHQLS